MARCRCAPHRPTRPRVAPWPDGVSFSDRDYREISVELKISANSVGAALHRARERLKARLEARDRRGAVARM